MTTNKTILNVLINIRFKFSMNKFEEIYGEGVSYSRLEQESYLELKEMTFDLLKRKIKFRKHERNGMVLTLKAEMTKKEHEKFLDLYNKKTFTFFSNFIVSDVKISEE